jgi:hypothetical protein
LDTVDEDAWNNYWLTTQVNANILLVKEISYLAFSLLRKRTILGLEKGGVSFKNPQNSKAGHLQVPGRVHEGPFLSNQDGLMGIYSFSLCQTSSSPSLYLFIRALRDNSM